jgi:type II secretory pathway pseudopilin PulG
MEMTMKLKTIPLALAAAGWLITSSTFAQTSDQRLQQLEAQVRTLMQQLQDLKAEQAKTPATPQGAAAAITDLKNQVEANHKEVVVGGDIPGSFRVPGSDTSIRVYGFAEMTAWRDSKAATQYDFSSATAFQPLDGSADANRTGNLKFGARTSRLGVEASTPTKYGPLGAKVEFDFATEAGNTLDSAADQANRQAYTNSYRPRLRHAYVTVGPWTAGQTWSTFMDLDTLPETLDFNGPPASPFVRQPLIKYAYATPDYGTFTAAVENPVSFVTGGTSVANNFDKTPDFILRYDKSHDWGQWNARLLSTEYRLDDGAGLSAQRRGFGFGLGAMVKTRGDDFFTVQYTDGNGLGRYNISFADAAVYDAANSKILFEKARGIVLGYQAKFSDTMRANVAYAVQKAQNDELAGLGFFNNRTLTQGHVNLIWTPIKNLDVGAEYLWGTRETFDLGTGSATGKLSRIMGSVKYSF